MLPAPRLSRYIQLFAVLLSALVLFYTASKVISVRSLELPAAIADIPDRKLWEPEAKELVVAKIGRAHV